MRVVNQSKHALKSLLYNQNRERGNIRDLQYSTFFQSQRERLITLDQPELQGAWQSIGEKAETSIKLYPVICYQANTFPPWTCRSDMMGCHYIATSSISCPDFFKRRESLYPRSKQYGNHRTSCGIFMDVHGFSSKPCLTARGYFRIKCTPYFANPPSTLVDPSLWPGAHCATRCQWMIHQDLCSVEVLCREFLVQCGSMEFLPASSNQLCFLMTCSRPSTSRNLYISSLCSFWVVQSFKLPLKSLYSLSDLVVHCQSQGFI